MKRVDFFGSLGECLKHASENYDLESLCDLMTEFTGQNKRTIGRWLHKEGEGNVPKSLSGIKARYFLEIIGYKISDINDVNHSDILTFGKLIGFGLLSLEEAGEKIGISDTSRVTKIVLGKSGVSTDRLDSMIQCNYEHREDLSKKINYWKEKTGFYVESSGVIESLDEEYPEDIPELVINEHEEVLNALSNGLKTVLHLGELVVSNAFTADERQRLRDISGRDTVLAVSTIVIKLSGERARRRSIEKSRSAF